MLAVSTLLFDESSYRNVVCLGLILDENGQKMSKSQGNIVEPWDVLDTYGADAFRWYFFTSKYPWDGYRFSLETLGEAVRQFMLQLWNTYGFYVLYANANGVAAESLSLDAAELTELDRWALSRLDATVETVRDGLDDFDATGAGRAIAEYVDELSNWYVRRSRRRFWDGDPAAFATLHHALVTVAKLLAPFTPFIADEIYENLDGSEPSVHLCDFPRSPAHDAELEQAMAVARETVRLGLAARGQAKLKLRQPLHAAVVVAAGRRARGDRAAGRDRPRRAQRARAALRLRGRRARRGRDQAQLPHARAALRQADADGRGGGRRARPRARGGDAARWRHGRRSTSAATSTRSPPRTCWSR